MARSNTSSGGSMLPPNIPPHVASTSPVASTQWNYRAKELPLNLILVIISHVEDLGDIARITRTSRLLYYLTLPRLYENVILHSYDQIRYVDGRPEGFGSGSPFSMGLHGLVTKSHGTYARRFRLWGKWKENDVEDFAKGRVPDNSMMLNTLVRASMDKMPKLEEFSWELDTKPLETIYHGLQLRKTLTSLTLKFPTKRIPRPTVEMPPLPNLRYVALMDMDPLCHPDDPSVMLLHATNLETLKLHWSPRMRDEGEPSVSLHDVFGKLAVANKTLPLKDFGLANLYARRSTTFDFFQFKTIERVAMLNCFGSGEAHTVFLDSTWKFDDISRFKFPHIKMMRSNSLDRNDVAIMAQQSGLEEFYIVNARRKPTSKRQTPNFSGNGYSPSGPGAGPSPTSNSSSSSPSNSNGRVTPSSEVINLASDYLAVITSKIGPSMKRLLLSDQWNLGYSALASLINHCPNLEQLGVALEDNNITFMRNFMPFARKLYALKILVDPGSELYQHIHTIEDSLHMIPMSRELCRNEYRNLRYIGIADKIFECGKVIEGVGEDGNVQSIREMRPLTWEDVKHVGIWGYDTLDL